MTISNSTRARAHARRGEHGYVFARTAHSTASRRAQRTNTHLWKARHSIDNGRWPFGAATHARAL
jgi:hypothetical protein